MLRSSAVRLHLLFKNVGIFKKSIPSTTFGKIKLMSTHNTETDTQFDQRYENFLSSTKIDGWDVRRTDLFGHDLVPEPKIIIAALKACRRVNDLALAIRILEALKDKCGNEVNEIYPWYIQEIKPTLTDLGIPTLEELGYDKPEFALQNVDDMQ
ncbi:cytochrome c oxidase subunit 5A, mitochondrial-like [Rhynchophorus ferrugineus]|uniref:Cytochrome c oxidase subunit 5A, mitochondrial n=1 Tax=Rhynchophorus ferrugineus TaxID=354439 RepID=A0A834IXZ3_RHYFE|nr:hypothetical protein GWI33_003424 [Rhynchophorus ferrugineus]